MATSENRKPELRKDAVSNRWVIFSPARAKRPSDFKSKSPAVSDQQLQQRCPFCIGNENECAPEIFRVPPDNPDWRIRVIQNLYPALFRDLQDPFATPGLGDALPGSVIDGFGFHDVIIETPVHSLQLPDLSPEEIGQVFVAYTKRIEQLSAHNSVKYVQVHTKRRNRLKQQTMNDVVFVMTNSRLEKKKKVRNKKSLEINFEDIPSYDEWIMEEEDETAEGIRLEDEDLVQEEDGEEVSTPIHEDVPTPIHEDVPAELHR